MKRSALINQSNVNLQGKWKSIPYVGLRKSHSDHQCSIKATLKPYQLEGLFLLWLRENGVGGTILGEKTGLGKTLQVLGFFQHIKESRKPSLQNSAPFLVVCSLSVVDSWISEVSNWASNLSVLEYHGTLEERRVEKAIIAHQRRSSPQCLPGIVVTRYDTVMLDVVLFR